MTNALIGFLIGISGAFFIANLAVQDASDKIARKTFTCQSGDSFWTRKKWACTEAEFNACKL